MEIWWLWMGAASLFILCEAMRLPLPFLWLSFGSALAGILALLGIPLAGQTAVFVNVSGILIVLERRFKERYRYKGSALAQPDFEHPTALLTKQDDIENIFRPSGAGWEIRYGGKSYNIKQTIGLIHIRNLIIHSGKELHASDLKNMAHEGSFIIGAKSYSTMSQEQLAGENLRISGETVSENAIERVPLNELKTIRDELEQRILSNDYDDPDEKIDGEATLAKIDRYLSVNTNKKGHSRLLNSQADTDRKAVSAAITRCRSSFSEHKELYTHFSSFIKAEGNSFYYCPDRDMEWMLNAKN